MFSLVSFLIYSLNYSEYFVQAAGKELPVASLEYEGLEYPRYARERDVYQRTLRRLAPMPKPKPPAKKSSSSKPKKSKKSSSSSCSSKGKASSESSGARTPSNRRGSKSSSSSAAARNSRSSRGTRERPASSSSRGHTSQEGPSAPIRSTSSGYGPHEQRLLFLEREPTVSGEYLEDWLQPLVSLSFSDSESAHIIGVEIPLLNDGTPVSRMIQEYIPTHTHEEYVALQALQELTQEFANEWNQLLQAISQVSDDFYGELAIVREEGLRPEGAIVREEGLPPEGAIVREEGLRPEGGFAPPLPDHVNIKPLPQRDGILYNKADDLQLPTFSDDYGSFYESLSDFEDNLMRHGNSFDLEGGMILTSDDEMFFESSLSGEEVPWSDFEEEFMRKGKPLGEDDEMLFDSPRDDRQRRLRATQNPSKSVVDQNDDLIHLRSRRGGGTARNKGFSSRKV